MPELVATDAQQDHAELTFTVCDGELPKGIKLRTDGFFSGGAPAKVAKTTKYTGTFCVSDGIAKDTKDFTNSVTAVAEFMVATGGSITTVGDYKVHTFKKGSGTFTVKKHGNSG